MVFPLFVGAGAGVERLTSGAATVSKTGCTAGNLIAVHMHVLGTTGDWSGLSNAVNIEAIDGTDNDLTTLRTGGEFQVRVGRVMADGTCSVDFGVGASGEDIAARMYEFSGESAATTLAGVFENGAGTTDTAAATNTTPAAGPVTTNGTERLALNFLALDSAQAIGSFTGETTVDWTEAVAEYVGTTLTLQLQTTQVASASTFQEGSTTVGVSTPWLSISSALIPATRKTGRHYKRFYGPAQLGAVATTLYTVPSDARATLRRIFANNPSGAPVSVDVSIGVDAASTKVVDRTIPAGGELDLRRLANHTLEAGEVLQGFASDTSVVIVVEGVETTS